MSSLLTGEGQQLILATLVRYPALFADKLGLIHYQYFQGYEAQVVARIIYDHVQRHRAIPGLDVLAALVTDHARKKDMPELPEYWQRIVDTGVTESDAKATADMFLGTIRDAKVYNVLTEIVVAFKEGKTAEINFEMVRKFQDALVITEPAKQMEAVSFAEIALTPPDEGNCLLGDDFIKRGGGMLFIGPTGGGKSTASVQQDMLWANGLPAHGIKPSGPLNILTIGAEDDANDLHQMAASVGTELGFTEAQWDVVHQRTNYLHCNDKCGDEFLAFLDRACEKYKPDLLRINPLNAFIGDDWTKGNVVAKFCRTGLNPVLTRHKCGLVLVHHVNKPTANTRDTSKWKPSDWAYAYAGSADLANWARAMVVMDPTASAEVYTWIAAKRANRIGWTDPEGGWAISRRYFAHNPDPKKLVWAEPTDDQLTTMEEAENERTAPKRGKGKGRSQSYNAEQLLKPLEKGPLGVKEWLKELTDAGCKISQSVLYTRIGIWTNIGTVDKTKDDTYKLISSGNPVKSHHV